MKVATSELEGKALDWVVAKLEEPELEVFDFEYEWEKYGYAASVDWEQGGPIIEREGITLVCAEGAYSPKERGYEFYWVAEEGGQRAEESYGPQGDNWGTCFRIEKSITGKTPLIAAMRCYVASKLGGEVEIPEEVK